MKPLQPNDPRQVGGIRLHGRLGTGGMGTVYFGVTSDAEQVAVKVIRDAYADKSDVRERFDREISALGMVQGPRVASLVAASEPGAEHPWLAMEYVRGLSLKEYVNDHGQLAADMGASLGELLLEALAAIHQAGLLHRDLKPGNIMLGADGPKVIDFGLVALTEGEADLELTASGVLLGSPVCMSPQQFESPKGLTPAADVYSLGASLLFALTKHYPYERDSINALRYAVTQASVAPDLSGVPPALEPIVEAMLAYEPEERPDLDKAAVKFREFLDATGLPARTARMQLAALTYIERPSDPPADAEPPPRPRRLRPHETPAISPLVGELAERLRSAYARRDSL